jgi:hypothetical protein
MKLATMKQLLTALVLTVLLTGCTQSSTPPDKELITPSNPSAGPTWTTEQQAAIDAVDAYLTTWITISQDLSGQDWNRIYNVASIDMASLDMDEWTIWAREEYTLVGTPTFTALSVTSSHNDGSSKVHTVVGCFDGLGVYLATYEGDPVDPTAPGYRGVAVMTVARAETGRNVVTSYEDRDETC